jgi:hypothetical protein
LDLLISKKNILIKSDHLKNIVRNNRFDVINYIMNYKVILDESLASECTCSSMLKHLIVHGMPMNIKTLEFLISNKNYNFN